MRPLSNFFARLSPRTGHQQRRPGDAEAGAAPSNSSLYEGSSAQRPRSTASTHWPSNPFRHHQHDAEAMPPAPLNVQQRQADVRRPETAHVEVGEAPPRPSEAPSGRPLFQQPERRHRHGHRRKHHRRPGPYATTQKKQSVLRDPAVRIKLLHVAISGLLFLLTLVVFLALQPTTPVFSSSFRVVNSLLIVVFAIVFIHSGIRLGTLIRAARRRQRRIARKNAKADGLLGSVDSCIDAVTAAATTNQPRTATNAHSTRAPYFDDPEIGLPPPGEPFRVILARDEELGLTDDVAAAGPHQYPGGLHSPLPPTQQQEQQQQRQHDGGIERHDRSMAEVLDDDDNEEPAASAAATAAAAATRPKPPPPVYGVWRGSVRADPNLLHWQRVPGPASSSSGASAVISEDAAADGAYASDDGHGPKPPSYVTQEPVPHPAYRPREQTLPSTRYLV